MDATKTDSGGEGSYYESRSDFSNHQPITVRQRGAPSGANSFIDVPSGDEEPGESCPEDCPFRQHYDAEDEKPDISFPEPEGDDGSLAAVSGRLYTPISSGWQTRILELLPNAHGAALESNLHVVDLVFRPGAVLHKKQRAISYQALSYCCGPPDNSRRVNCNGESLPITNHLYHALQTLRETTKPLYLWVDAICIHQDDEVEKAAQVVNMLTIYRKASGVVVWLGASGHHTALTADLLPALPERYGNHSARCQQLLQKVLLGIHDIFSRPWFHRLWVKQEVYAAEQVVVRCGSRCILWELLNRSFTKIESWLSDDEPAKSMLPSGLDLKLKDHRRRLNSLSRVTRRELVERHEGERRNPWMETYPLMVGQDIVNVLRRCAGSLCSKPQDHVYAVLGMTDLSYQAGQDDSTEHPALVVNYGKSLATVFTEVTRHVIERDMSLGMLYLEIDYGTDDSIPGKPSWVANLLFAEEKGSWLPWLSESMKAYYGSMGPFNDVIMAPQPLLGVSPCQSSAQLPLKGCVVGTITPEQCPEYADLFRFNTSVSNSAGIGTSGNYLHQRHILPPDTQAQLEKKFAKSTSVTLEIEDNTLEAIAAALNSFIMGGRFPNIQKYTSERDFICHFMTREEIHVESKSRGLLVLRIDLDRDRRTLPWRDWVVPVPFQPTGLFECSYESEFLQDFRRAQEADKDDNYHPLYRCRYVQSWATTIEDALPRSWLMPEKARVGDLIIAVGGFTPLLVRLRPNLQTYEYVGPAMPFQMKANDELPFKTLIFCAWTFIMLKDAGELKEFVLD